MLRRLAIALALISTACGGSQRSVDDTPSLRSISRGGATALDRTPLRGVAVAPYVLPYTTANAISDFWDCRGRRTHRGLDLGGVGADSGLGTPVRSMGRARVTHLGSPEHDARRFGRRLTDGGTVTRGGRQLPTESHVPGYGRVWFFTENYGSWRTGVIVTTELLDGPLAGHRVRYMHLGAIHPELRVGDIVEAGQEVGLMGGTAVLESTPHVHIDAEDASGRRVNLEPYFGMVAAEEPSGGRCRDS